MCNFKEMWENVEYHGKQPAAIKEILCLLVHTDQGCLSGILPGRGSNRNERLHKDMNSHMKNNRYGVELAYATSTLFSHNEKIRAKLENRCVAPINSISSTINENRVIWSV